MSRRDGDGRGRVRKMATNQKENTREGRRAAICSWMLLTAVFLLLLFYRIIDNVSSENPVISPQNDCVSRICLMEGKNRDPHKNQRPGWEYSQRSRPNEGCDLWLTDSKLGTRRETTPPNERIPKCAAEREGRQSADRSGTPEDTQLDWDRPIGSYL